MADEHEYEPRDCEPQGEPRELTPQAWMGAAIMALGEARAALTALGLSDMAQTCRHMQETVRARMQRTGNQNAG